MKTLKYILFLSIIAGAMACTPTSKMVMSLAAPDLEPKRYENLSILSMLPSMDARTRVEVAVATKMQEEGINGKATFTLFTFAGNQEVMEQIDLSPEELKEVVREKVAKNKIDGLLTITLLDAQQEERYVAGSSIGVSIAYNGYPTYAYNPYDYYAYAYGEVFSKPGYYVNSSTYFLELNMYDISTEKLLWSGQMTVKDPSSIHKEEEKFAEVIIHELLSKKVIMK